MKKSETLRRMDSAIAILKAWIASGLQQQAFADSIEEHRNHVTKPGNFDPKLLVSNLVTIPILDRMDAKPEVEVYLPGGKFSHKYEDHPLVKAARKRFQPFLDSYVQPAIEEDTEAPLSTGGEPKTMCEGCTLLEQMVNVYAEIVQKQVQENTDLKEILAQREKENRKVIEALQTELATRPKSEKNTALKKRIDEGLKR